MRYSIPIFSDFIWVIVRSDSALKFNSVEDLKVSLSASSEEYGLVTRSIAKEIACSK